MEGSSPEQDGGWSQVGDFQLVMSVLGQHRSCDRVGGAGPRARGIPQRQVCSSHGYKVKRDLRVFCERPPAGLSCHSPRKLAAQLATCAKAGLQESVGHPRGVILRTLALGPRDLGVPSGLGPVPPSLTRMLLVLLAVLERLAAICPSLCIGRHWRSGVSCFSHIPLRCGDVRENPGQPRPQAPPVQGGVREPCP